EDFVRSIEMTNCQFVVSYCPSLLCGKIQFNDTLRPRRLINCRLLLVDRVRGLDVICHPSRLLHWVPTTTVNGLPFMIVDDRVPNWIISPPPPPPPWSSPIASHQ